MDAFPSLGDTYRRLTTRVSGAVDDIAPRARQLGAQIGTAVDDAVEATANATANASRGLDNAISWMIGEEPDSPPAPRARPSRTREAQGQVPIWTPLPVPRWEDMRKGDSVFRKGLPAVITKIDYEINPPGFVVCMEDGGNEVNTDGVNISLSTSRSGRCLQPGVRVCVVGLQNRQDLNGTRGTLVSLNAEGRWFVSPSGGGDPISVRPQNLSVLLDQVTEPPSPSVRTVAQPEEYEDRGTPCEPHAEVPQCRATPAEVPPFEAQSLKDVDRATSRELHAEVPESRVAPAEVPTLEAQSLEDERATPHEPRAEVPECRDSPPSAPTLEAQSLEDAGASSCSRCEAEHCAVVAGSEDAHTSPEREAL